jgi:hypothetical protein
MEIVVFVILCFFLGAAIAAVISLATKSVGYAHPICLSTPLEEQARTGTVTCVKCKKKFSQGYFDMNWDLVGDMEGNVSTWNDCPHCGHLEITKQWNSYEINGLPKIKWDNSLFRNDRS